VIGVGWRLSPHASSFKLKFTISKTSNFTEFSSKCPLEIYWKSHLLICWTPWNIEHVTSRGSVFKHSVDYVGTAVWSTVYASVVGNIITVFSCTSARVRKLCDTACHTCPSRHFHILTVLQWPAKPVQHAACECRFMLSVYILHTYYFKNLDLTLVRCRYH